MRPLIKYCCLITKSINKELGTALTETLNPLYRTFTDVTRKLERFFKYVEAECWKFMPLSRCQSLIEPMGIHIDIDYLLFMDLCRQSQAFLRLLFI